MIKDYFEKDEVVGMMTKRDKGEQECTRVVWKDVLREIRYCLRVNRRGWTGGLIRGVFEGKIQGWQKGTLHGWQIHVHET
jgi:hypothetical protein